MESNFCHKLNEGQKGNTLTEIDTFQIHFTKLTANKSKSNSPGEQGEKAHLVDKENHHPEERVDQIGDFSQTNSKLCRVKSQYQPFS